MLLKPRKTFYLLGCAALTALFACNRSYSEYCEEMMDCQDGNDRDIAACEEAMSGTEDIVSILDCNEYWDAFMDCREEESSCRNDSYTTVDSDGDDRCEDEEDDFDACMEL